MIQNYNLDINAHQLIGKVGGQLTLVTNDVDKIDKKNSSKSQKGYKIFYFIICVVLAPFFHLNFDFSFFFFFKRKTKYFAEMESAPRNVQVRTLSSSTMVITWEPPETPNGQVTVSIFVFIFIEFIFRLLLFFCILRFEFFFYCFVFQMEIVFVIS